MFKLIIGAWLLTTVAMAQTAPKKTKSTSDNSPAQLGRSVSASGKSASGSGNRSDKPVSKKPIPPSPMSDKTQSSNGLNPGYKKEKAEGRGISPRFSPRTTASGARKDTMNQRKP